MFRTLTATAALCFPSISAAAEALVDLTLNYYARENVNETDNDIIQALAGITLIEPDGGTRWTLGAGIRNEFFTKETPYDLEFGTLRYWTRDTGSNGIGLTLRAIENEGAALDLAGFATYERQYWGLRGLAGLQAVTGDARFAGKRHVGFFALGEASVYPTENIALRSSLIFDDIDILGTVAVEMKVPYVPISIGMDWSASLDNYRADEYYNDLTYRIQYVHKLGSIRNRERTRPIRAMARPVNPL
ncbi:hypothetical protein [Halovulum sp. GXIMD14793]